MVMADIELSVEREHVGVITINRPHRANALTPDMFDELSDLVEDVQGRRDVRVLVLTGAGRHFCSGGDLASVTDADEEAESAAAIGELLRRVQRLPKAIRSSDKPVIAAINGLAIAAGMDVALACDIRLGSSNARFRESYVRAGLIPGEGGSWLLPRLVGTSRALELLMTGDEVDAGTALAWGIVSRVYDDSEFLERSLDVAERIATAPPVHVQLIKRAVHAGLESTFDESLELARAHMVIARGLDDSRRAREALASGESAAFEGR